MRWDAAVLSHPNSDLSADDTSPLWGNCILKRNRHHIPAIFTAIRLKYQQGVSCHPRIMCQIWSLKNIKYILNTVHWTRSVFNCHSSDKPSVRHSITFLISILIMGILSLMAWLCFMAFEMDGEAVSGITQTHHATRSHAALLLTNNMWIGWDERIRNGASIIFWSSSTSMQIISPMREEQVVRQVWTCGKRWKQIQTVEGKQKSTS